VSRETLYADSGELSIAYQVLGEGPPDVIFIPGFISHADLQWENPLFRRFQERVGAFSRLVVFDKRGTGLSERTLGSGSIEDRMDDVRAVADAADVERATVIGISEGGPMALVYAATYPERVRSLVIWGASARIRRDDDYPIGVDEELLAGFPAAIRRLWGSGRALPMFLNRIDDAVDQEAIARYERAAATPRQVEQILTHNIEIDVRGALPSIQVPTLVVHRTGDPLIPIAHGRYIAEQVESATFREFAGDWHLNGTGTPEDEVFDAIEEFVTGETGVRHEVDRVLATVLFTDICDSTARAATLGDSQWRTLLERHDAATAEEVGRHRGQLVKTTGDGALASFEGPARAVRCAQAIQRRMDGIGVAVRAGVHTGEIERRGDDVAGISVHIGARVAALAGPGEVLASQTVKDLVLGSDLHFEARGAHELKGVPGEWQLYAVPN
jgi:pimeloyl-ACP methyl ester carboxylesterase